MTRLAITLATAWLAVAALDAHAAPTRLFENRFGQVEVPVTPRCIVSLHDFSLTTQLLELGHTPCGSSGRKRLFEAPVFRGATGHFDTTSIRYIGSHQAPDIETIAALEPDLIVGLSYHANLRETLSRIAPVVLMPAREAGIQANAAELAALTGTQTRYQAMLDEYRAVIADLRARVPHRDRITITTLELYADGFQLIGRGGMDDVIADAGFARVPAYRQAQRHIPYSLEQLGAFDSDVMVDSYDANLDSDAQTAAVRALPSWQNLFAVRHDQFLYVDRSRATDTMQGLLRSAYQLRSRLTGHPIQVQRP